MNGHTIAARAGAGLVAMVAGAASWEHIASVAMAAGERPWVAYSLPVAIDGLIVVGVGAVIEDRRAGRLPRISARVAIVIGVAMTLAANIASAAPSWTARAVAVAAPVAFLLSVEVLTRSGRPAPAASGHGHTSAPERRQRPPRQRSRTGRGDGAARVATAMASAPDATVAELSRLAGVSRSTVRRHLNGHQVASTSTTVPGG